MNDNTCILIPSCDAFADAHPPFMACLEKYWPDREWPMHGLSEYGWGENPLAVGNDNGWCANLIKGLEQIDDDYVMMFLEDMFLCETPDQDAMNYAHRLVSQYNVGAVRVGPGAEECEPTQHGPGVGKMLRSSAYRISTSPTIWDKKYLLSVLRGPRINTAWDFEIVGTRQSVAPNGKQILKMLQEPPPVQVLYTAITRGRFEEGALQWLRRVGIEVETDRPVKGWEVGQRWPKT